MGQSIYQMHRQRGIDFTVSALFGGNAARHKAWIARQIAKKTWFALARPEQRIPRGGWETRLILAGRGFGKTRMGAEWVKSEATSGVARYVNLIGATADDARQIMIEGESGLLAICADMPSRPVYKKRDRELHWHNGAVSQIFTADEPERLRGKQHSKLWLDELAAWRYPEAFDQADFGLRLSHGGANTPQMLITTTPKPSKIIKNLIAQPDIVVISGSTYDNADNLAPSTIQRLIKKYEGTRLGMQELHAKILTDVPGALWSYDTIEKVQKRKKHRKEDFMRIMIGVDPAVSVGEDSDETGIIIVGEHETDGAGVLGDFSGKYAPQEWGGLVKKLFDEWQATLIIAERNNGGALVEANIKAVDSSLPVKTVWASRGKYTRAEPIAMKYEQGQVWHEGHFPELVDQMTEFVPGMKKSPDRVDALVWALTEIFDNGAIIVC